PSVLFSTAFSFFFPLPLLAGNAMNDKTESKRKGRPKTENQALKDIPLPLMNQWKDEFKAHSRVKCPNLGCWLEFPSIYGLKYHFQRCQGGAIVEKRTFPCLYCEAVFTSKTQLEKHCLWNHLDRPLPAASPPAENKVQKATSKGVEKAVALQHPENGEHAAVSQGIRALKTTAAGGGEGAATPLGQTPGTRSSKHQASRQAFKQEEDPERMKHRRKQKTPKKFTGEQPSISGTFGLKGLAKAEDKAKAHRAKKLEASLLSSNAEDHKKKHAGSNVKKEATALATAPSTTATPEEQWQRIINEKGEVACPTCGMITRKTVLGLKKHMEVCQKLQDALKCQHCKKQFKSKAGLNYHTMAEHVNKLAKDWTKRRMKDDLVPETKQLNYTRPGLPKLNPRLLEAWKNEVKEKGHINCPNDCCAAIYCSVSGLKAHLANCNKGGHSVGKYRCLLCQKEFSSESGVKYHIIKTHSENWFHTSTDSLKKKKSKEPSTPSNEEQKTSPDGKKRGRKPKERPSEFFPKDTESLLGNINHKKRGNKPFHAPKFGASKMPEK
uniref:Zinc finger protein 512B n=1 Tax=Naja naja TaxID=35670 RepID=A0A8C6X243_NAJNA